MKRPEIDKKFLSRPYAKYLNRKMQDPPQEVLSFLKEKKMMDPQYALLPENNNMDEILKSGYMECEYGYCTLPNGGGYVAMLNKMPGVTFEMYQFWCNWWSTAPDATLRYRIWNPKDHCAAGFRWSNEEIGGHVEDLVFLNHLEPENLGISKEKVKKSSLLWADGGNVISKRVDADPFSAPVPGVVCHFVREMDDGSGIELRSRFWKGFQFGENGLFDAMGPHTPKETVDSLYGLAEHNAVEMAHLASILPDLYREEKEVFYK